MGWELIRPRSYRFYSKGSFCKETQVSKTIAGAKVDPCKVSFKKLTGFFTNVCNRKICCDLEALLRDII